MNVALTGATGFVGSHVLAALVEHGHEVTALVRDDAQVDAVRTRGANAAVVDLYDRSAVASLLSAADAAIHTASPGDTTSAALDSAVVDAVIDALGGSAKPYVQIGGAMGLRVQLLHHRGLSLQRASAGGMEGADRTPGARRTRHARRRDRPGRRLR